MAAIGYGDMRGQMELQRFQGCDVLMRLSPSCAGCKAGDGISDYTENNGLTVCNKTPSGVPALGLHRVVRRAYDF